MWTPTPATSTSRSPESGGLPCVKTNPLQSGIELSIRYKLYGRRSTGLPMLRFALFLRIHPFTTKHCYRPISSPCMTSSREGSVFCKRCKSTNVNFGEDKRTSGIHRVSTVRVKPWGCISRTGSGCSSRPSSSHPAPDPRPQAEHTLHVCLCVGYHRN